jgi:hypothetical protein
VRESLRSDQPDILGISNQYLFHHKFTTQVTPLHSWLLHMTMKGGQRKKLLYTNILCILLLQWLDLSLVNGAKVPAIIVFGDSSVDAGNNNFISTVARSNFQPYGRDFLGGKPTGRFSNGRIATDFISEAFGIKPYIPAYLDPSFNISQFATGVSFASAATGYDNATSDVLVHYIYTFNYLLFVIFIFI